MKINKQKILQSRQSRKGINQQGYTLIEVVIAMLVTGVIFVAVYSLFAKAIKYDTEGRYEIIASELAQEGIEIIKNKKEKNEMDWAVWKGPDSHVSIEELTTFKGIDNLSECNPSLQLAPDYNFSCSGSKVMQYNKDSKRFEANCGGNCLGPKFTRKCSTNLIDGNNSTLRVSCEVGWGSLILNNGSNDEIERSVKTNLILTDWER